MTDLEFPHLFLVQAYGPDSQRYRNPVGGGGEFELPPRPNRQGHADRVRDALESAWAEDEADAAARQGRSLPAKDGTYLEIESAPDFDLRLISLEDRRLGIELLNVHDSHDNLGRSITRATIYVPRGKQTNLIQKIQRYRDENTHKDKPKNQKLVESIELIRRAVLQSFWYDPIGLLPDAHRREWCEVWLVASPATRAAIETDFRGMCRLLGIPIQEGAIHFVERIVVMVHANANELEELLASIAHVAEFRKGKEVAAFWTEMPNAEQAEWVEGLSPRLSIGMDASVAVTVIDTGVTNGHPLLSPIIPDDRCTTVQVSWGSADSHGHGTAMCGTVAFGDELDSLLQTSAPVVLPYHIESVKLIARPGQQSDDTLYGERTLQAFSRAELLDPEAARVYCIAVTSIDGRDHGRPSSWSGAIDNAIAGVDDDQQKLCVIAAGNIFDPSEWRTYPDANLTNSIHDPAQAWNALTVGAVTFLDHIDDPALAAYSPVAARGQLSPFSTTSRAWDARWPNKPDIVLEGGNVGADGSGFTSEFDHLSLLTTGHQPQTSLFSTNYATSCGAALASQMCARLWAAYPAAWPETIRGLMVHSAQWTEELKAQLTSPEANDTANMANLLKVVGYGVPDFARALQSARNSLTLIAEQVIQPFEINDKNNTARAHDMHLYRLPWPVEALSSLPGETPIIIDVTLSYFIEPAPGEKGWRDKYRYRSHGLDFDLKKSTEDEDEFVLRLNKAAREDEGNYGGSGIKWVIGSQKGRSHGSIHRDWVEITAAEARDCNALGVFPRTGWWKERAHLNRVTSPARYSLIVTLRTASAELTIDVDLYTPIAQQITAEITT